MHLAVEERRRARVRLMLVFIVYSMISNCTISREDVGRLLIVLSMIR